MVVEVTQVERLECVPERVVVVDAVLEPLDPRDDGVELQRVERPAGGHGSPDGGILREGAVAAVEDRGEVAQRDRRMAERSARAAALEQGRETGVDRHRGG